MDKLQTIMLCMSVFLNFASVCTICYAFYRFINKPRENLESRVNTLEVTVKQHDESLKQGNDRFREQAGTNEMVFSVLLAFVDFEIAYCLHTGYEHNTDLLKAKDKLDAYLSKR